MSKRDRLIAFLLTLEEDDPDIDIMDDFCRDLKRTAE